jgi:preprotein translocase subunit SecG
MDVSLLGYLEWWKQTLAVLFIVVSAILIIIVLLQKGRGGGLSAAFGGAGGQSAFGSKTGDVFTWATIVIVSVFMVLAMVLAAHFTTTYKSDQPPAGYENRPASRPAGLPGAGEAGSKPVGAGPATTPAENAPASAPAAPTAPVTPPVEKTPAAPSPAAPIVPAAPATPPATPAGAGAK